MHESNRNSCERSGSRGRRLGTSEVRYGSLRLGAPFGSTLLLALVLLVSFVLGAEGLSRGRWADRWLPPPSIAGFPGLGLKITLLERLRAERGRVDCLILGPSSINAAIDPERMEQEYRRRSGEAGPTCFNFGLADLTIEGAAGLARILAAEHRPSLLILSILPRVGEGVRESEKRVLGNPWSRHRLGDWSIDGWLFQHSLAYRRFLGFRQWLEAPSFFEVERNKALHVTPFGYGPGDGTIVVDVSSPVDPRNPDPWDARFLGPERMRVSETDLAPLRGVLGRTRQLEVVLLETPIHASFAQFLRGGAPEWERFQGFVADRGRAYGAESWRVGTVLDGIPANGWRDRLHMNPIGSERFSRWLAGRLLEAVEAGELSGRWSQR